MTTKELEYAKIVIIICILLLMIIAVFLVIKNGELTKKVSALETKQSQYQELKRIDDQIIAKSQTGFGISSQTMDACENFSLSGVEKGASDLNAVMAQVNPILMDRKSALKELGY